MMQSYFAAFFTFSHNSFICVKSLTVVPHKEAVFSTSTTFPLYFSMLTTCPSRVFALMSWKAMLPPMSARAARRPLTVHWVGSCWNLLSWRKSLEPVVACCELHLRVKSRLRQSKAVGFGAEIVENYFVLLMSRRCLRVGLSRMVHRVRTMTFGLDTR